MARASKPDSWRGEGIDHGAVDLPAGGGRPRRHRVAGVVVDHAFATLHLGRQADRQSGDAARVGHRDDRLLGGRVDVGEQLAQFGLGGVVLADLDQRQGASAAGILGEGFAVVAGDGLRIPAEADRQAQGAPRDQPVERAGMVGGHGQPAVDRLRPTGMQRRAGGPIGACGLHPGVGGGRLGDDAEVFLSLGEVVGAPVGEACRPGGLRRARTGAGSGGSGPFAGEVVAAVEEIGEAERAAQAVEVGVGEELRQLAFAQQALGGEGRAVRQGTAEPRGEGVGGLCILTREVADRKAAQPQLAAVDAAAPRRTSSSSGEGTGM